MDGVTYGYHIIAMLLIIGITLRIIAERLSARHLSLCMYVCMYVVRHALLRMRASVSVRKVMRLACHGVHRRLDGPRTGPKAWTFAGDAEKKGAKSAGS